jgi:hypothetical protein
MESSRHEKNARRRSGVDLQPRRLGLRSRAGRDDNDADHENSRDRDHQSRRRSGEGARDPAGRSSGYRQPLLGRQDRPVVLAAGPSGRGVHPECHRPNRCPRDARKLAVGASSSHELRVAPAWPAQPASPAARNGATAGLPFGKVTASQQPLQMLLSILLSCCSMARSSGVGPADCEAPGRGTVSPVDVR